MRILQVSPYFYPYIGGQERYVWNLAKALAKKGHEIEILTSNFPRWKEQEIVDGVEIRRFNIIGRPLNNPISITMLFHLLKHCKHFNLIHAHNEHAASSFYCALTKHCVNIPLIVTCHGQLRFDNFAKDFIERVYSKTFGAWLFKKANKVITLSNSDKRYIHSLGVPIDKLHVIPNGVNLSDYILQCNDLAEAFPFEGKRVVLFVGPILKRKGPHILVQAIPLIVKEHKDTIFVFVGKGNFREEVEKLSRELGVERYVYFTGYVAERQLHHIYKRSDVFVLPSFSEGFPYTVLDAMVFSKPIVSTTLPCLIEYLSGSALLVTPGDYKSLANAVIKLLDDRKLAQKLGMKGRHLVETQFNWDVVIKKVLEVYSECL